MTKMTTLEIAKAFGTNVKGLCRITGYSKQAFDSIRREKIGGRTDRWAAAVAALRDHAETAHMKDRYEAERRFNERMALCDRLAKKDFGVKKADRGIDHA